MKPKKSTATPAAPMASTKGDLRQLKRNSSATVAELKSFLRQLKGKSPQEMMGLVAGSQLFRAICLSTALVAGAGLVFTIIPYALGSGNDKTAQAVEPKKAPASFPPNPTPQPAPGSTPGQPTPTAPDLSKLGIGEEKKAPPNENPLDDKKDDFLKGLD